MIFDIRFFSVHRERKKLVLLLMIDLTEFGKSIKMSNNDI